MVTRRFEQKVAELLPQFERARFGEHWQDSLCYRWKIGQGLTCYITRSGPSLPVSGQYCSINSKPLAQTDS